MGLGWIGRNGLCAGLLCKETALAISLAAAIVLHCESARANPRRIALLAAAAVAIVTIYGFLRFPMLLRMGTGAGGSDPASAGYEFAAIGAIATNGLAYFGFPFAVEMAEITGFENQSLSESCMHRRPSPHHIHPVASLREASASVLCDRIFPAATACSHNLQNMRPSTFTRVQLLLVWRSR